MCGILGIYSNTQVNNFESVLLKLHSRGPDFHSFFHEKNLYLGHTRLSIIDTSSGANQPFIFKDYVLVFNGEIYNFKELKLRLIEKGFIFNTSSDTEVLLYSYIYWGEECVNHFDGMWAFCIYDKINNKLFLSRDRIGEKPLIYYKDENKFIFGSEINAILPLLEKTEINVDNFSLSNFDIYNFRHIPSPYTGFKNIYKLEPGYNLIFKLDDFVLNKYKYFKIQKITIEADPIEQFDRIFKKSVYNTCYADVPVGIFLSGGIDSSLITAIMKDRNITTYSLGYDENDEEIIRADKIAKYLNVKNKKIYFKEYIQNVNIFDILKRVVSHYGEPINLIQIIYADLILQEMKKDGIKVAIGGNGADEMFYGYDGMNTLYLASEMKNIANKLGLGVLINNQNLKEKLYSSYINGLDYIKRDYREFIYAPILRGYAQEIISNKLIDIFSWLGLRIENEHSITIVNDIAGSMNGMELRTPFLNRDILDFSCNLTQEHKVKSFKDKTYNKFILKKTLERYLPKELIYQKKIGFGYGIKYFDLVLEQKDKVEYYIYIISKNIDLYDYDKVVALYQDYLDGKKVNIRCIISIVLVGIWYEKYFLN